MQQFFVPAVLDIALACVYLASQVRKERLPRMLHRWQLRFLFTSSSAPLRYFLADHPDPCKRELPILWTPQMQPWIGVIVAFTMGCYLPLTVIVTEYSTTYRRAQNKLSNERSSRMTDTLLNYEAIKLFTGAHGCRVSGSGDSIRLRAI